jgi:hypothetical protein
VPLVAPHSLGTVLTARRAFQVQLMKLQWISPRHGKSRILFLITLLHLTKPSLSSHTSTPSHGQRHDRPLRLVKSFLGRDVSGRRMLPQRPCT